MWAHKFSLTELLPEAKPRLSLPAAMRLLKEKRLQPPAEGIVKTIYPNPEDEIEVM